MASHKELLTRFTDFVCDEVVEEGAMLVDLYSHSGGGEGEQGKAVSSSGEVGGGEGGRGKAVSGSERWVVGRASGARL